MTLPQTLESYRTKHKLSVRELAKLIGISRMTYSRFMAGNDVSLKSLKLIQKWARDTAQMTEEQETIAHDPWVL